MLSPTDLEEQIEVYSKALETNAPSLQRYWDAWNVDNSEIWVKLPPSTIHGQANHYGCVMLLHSLKAPTDIEARLKVVGAARRLAEFGTMVRGKSGLKHVHGSLLLMVNTSIIYNFSSTDMISLLVLISYTSPTPLAYLHHISIPPK